MATIKTRSQKLNRSIHHCQNYLDKHKSNLEDMVQRQEYRIAHHIQQRHNRLKQHLITLLRAKYKNILPSPEK